MVHEHVYDDAGRMVETVVHTEPEWDAEERDLALAFTLYEQDEGPGGHPLSESVGPQANPDNPKGTHTYVGRLPMTNWALRAQLEVMREYEQQLEEAGIGPDERALILRSIHIAVDRVEREPST